MDSFLRHYLPTLSSGGDVLYFPIKGAVGVLWGHRAMCRLLSAALGLGVVSASSQAFTPPMPVGGFEGERLTCTTKGRPEGLLKWVSPPDLLYISGEYQHDDIQKDPGLIWGTR